MPEALTTLHGRRLGIAATGNLVANTITATPICTDATIVVGSEISNARAITIQLKDSNGKDVADRTVVQAFVLADANGDAIATTGGSTGIAIGTDGAILATLVAKKAFTLISEADGDIDLTWTDTGTEAAYLALLLPTGRLVISSALTNA